MLIPKNKKCVECGSKVQKIKENPELDYVCCTGCYRIYDKFVREKEVV